MKRNSIQFEGLTSLEQAFNYARTLPWLNQLETTPQDPEWHSEGNVAIHTDMVIKQVVREAGSEDEMLVVLTHAAAFHDIGKVISTREVEIDDRIRIVSPRHAQLGRT
jgi:response regulator RpfG family c-di-GMP phosphodiesterase